MPAGIFQLQSAGSSIIEVEAGASLDYESRSEYVVSLIVTDSGTGGAWDRENVTIIVIDVNEAPVLSDMVLTTPEGTAANTHLTPNVAAHDEDFGQALTYSITSQSVLGAFRLDAASCGSISSSSWSPALIG